MQHEEDCRRYIQSPVACACVVADAVVACGGLVIVGSVALVRSCVLCWLFLFWD